jgi:hypothetical protein
MGRRGLFYLLLLVVLSIITTSASVGIIIIIMRIYNYIIITDVWKIKMGVQGKQKAEGRKE